jgi:hypothetical protein
MSAIDRIIPTRVDSPLASFVLIGLAVLGSMTTTNPLESIWTCGLLLLLLRWFWWQTNPGIMLFCLIVPFIEIHATLIEANQAGLNLDDLFFGTGGKTFWMSTISLLSVAVGIRTIWATRSFKPAFSLESLISAARSIQHRPLILAFIAATFLSQAIDQLIPYTSSLRQLEVYAKGISEVFLLVVAIKFMVDRKHLLTVIIIFTYLIATSFYSFFSTWKDPLTLLLVASLVRISHFGIKNIIRLSPIILPALLLVSVWQNVKGDYRQFLNGGAFSQRIVVSQTEALTKFQELASEAVFSNDLLNEETIDATYRRVGYLEYFSNAVTKVPTEIPHENGKLLSANADFALIPRFLSPDKGIKDDKAKVEKYTDYHFGTYGGSSFSLGHYCEAYIDWGPSGMVLQLFLFGVLCGALYMIVIWRTQSINPLLTLGVLWVCMKPFGTFQDDMVNVIGSIFWGSVCHLIIFFPLYKQANGWLQRDHHSQ